MSQDLAQPVVLLYDANGNPIVFGQAAMANWLPVAIASDQTALPVTDNGGSITVDAASLPLPTGAATETTLSALNTNAADIETILTAIRDTAGVKKITDALPAGTNNIGDVDVVSSALPTGAATETTLSSINTKTLAAGQAVMASSSPVVIASNQTAIPVTDNSGSLTVDATSWPLPTGAATETTLSSINTKTLAAGQAVMAASSPVVIASNQTAIPITDNAGSLTVDGTVATTSAAASQADGHSVSIGATSDADSANTLIGRVKQIITRLAGGLPSALIGGRLDTNIGSWLGSTVPTIGQKTMAASVPVVFPSDQLIGVISGASEEPTFTVIGTAVVLGNGKSLLSVYNPTASVVALKLREYYVRNSQTTAVTGVAAQLEIHRFVMVSAPTGGTAITALAHDSGDTLQAGVDCRTGGTITGEVAQALDIMRISSDEWGPGTLDQEGAQQTISNYLPARVKRDAQQKAVCIMNPGQGAHLKCVTNTTAGSFDLIMVFTQV